MSPLLELKDLTKSYQSRLVLDGVSLEVQRAEFFSLLGPSGCGKSSTLRLIAGFETPDRGTIVSEGRVWNKLSVGARNCNMVFQHYALFPHMTVRENVAFGLEMQRLSHPEIQRLCDQALSLVKMQTFAKRLPSQLSGGQQQRVALARAIAPRPALLLLDEPLSALDKSLRQEMQVELKQLQEELSMTFLFVTHDQDEAMGLSDRMAIMHQGRILQVGSPREIYENPRSQTVASFLGEADFFGCMRHPDRGHLFCPESGLHFPGLKDLSEAVSRSSEILVRPEFWTFHSQPREGRAAAQITALSYRGRNLVYHLTLSSGKRISALADAETIFSRGDRVYVALKPREWNLLPREAR